MDNNWFKEESGEHPFDCDCSICEQGWEDIPVLECEEIGPDGELFPEDDQVL